jgi:hypothetical protein
MGLLVFAMSPLAAATAPLAAATHPLAAATHPLAAAMAPRQFFFGREVSDYSLSGETR